jgi:ribosomal protein L37AE/L43A
VENIATMTTTRRRKRKITERDWSRILGVISCPMCGSQDCQEDMPGLLYTCTQCNWQFWNPNLTSRQLDRKLRPSPKQLRELKKLEPK